MGRRKRKSVSYRPIRKAPTQFACPNCGQNAMKVEKLKRTEGSGYAIIKCSNCLLEERYDAGPLTDPVDVYAMLVDAFYGEAGDKQTEQARAAADAKSAAAAPVGTATPGAEPASAIPEAPAAPEKVKAKEKTSLADLQPVEAAGEEITEDLLKEAYSDDKDEVLDEIKKKKSDEKLPFPDDDLNDDDL
jgi:transcription elongation factor Elf1